MKAIDVFNWKKYPANVFYIAVPLTALGIALYGALAYLKWQEGDKGFAVIFAVAVVVLGLSIRQSLNIHKITSKIGHANMVEGKCKHCGETVIVNTLGSGSQSCYSIPSQSWCTCPDRDTNKSKRPVGLVKYNK